MPPDLVEGAAGSQFGDSSDNARRPYPLIFLLVPFSRGYRPGKRQLGRLRCGSDVQHPSGYESYATTRYRCLSGVHSPQSRHNDIDYCEYDCYVSVHIFTHDTLSFDLIWCPSCVRYLGRDWLIFKENILRKLRNFFGLRGY